MQEILENREPLNKKAKEFLMQERENPDPSSLYCLQLAQWGAEKGGLEIDSRVKDSLPILLSQPPGQMMKQLEGRLMYSEDPEEFLDLLGENRTPQDLAWSILDRAREILGSSLGLDRQPTRG